MHPRSALWIAPAAVDYVRRNPETASEVRSGQSIFVSKIPYDPVAYLEETDPRMKRYHACHRGASGGSLAGLCPAGVSTPRRANTETAQSPCAACHC